MRIGAWTVCSIALAMAGCGVFAKPQLSQAALNAIETRDVDADFDETFNAASGALFDAGYIISMSDRQGGLITGTKSIDRSRQRRFFNDKAIEDTHFAVSILVRETEMARCAVRVKTSINGQPRVDKHAIDAIWVLMQRQVLMSAPLAAADPVEHAEFE